MEGVAAGAGNGKIEKCCFSKDREQKSRFPTASTDSGRLLAYLYANGAIFRFRRGDIAHVPGGKRMAAGGRGG